MIIVRYAELALKGKNRADFEKQLVRNIKDCMKKNRKSGDVKRIRGRILIDTMYFPELAKVFGISSFSEAVEVNQDAEDIKKATLDHLKKGSFRVSVNRIDKFPMSSMELEREIGALIVDKTGNDVDLKNFEWNLEIELINGKAYVFNSRTEGPGGIPVGTQGKVLLIVEDEDSIQAGMLAMKRGCMVHVQKGGQHDISKLREYSYGYEVREIDDCDIIVTGRRDLPSKREYPGKLELHPLIGDGEPSKEIYR